MGQKVNPIGFRLGISRGHDAVWYATKREYRDSLVSDLRVRKYIEKQLRDSYIGRIETTRRNGVLDIRLHTSRPVNIIGGRDGSKIKELTAKLAEVAEMPTDKVHVEVLLIKEPELNAKLVALNIAQQLEKRMMFRRVMRWAVQNTMKKGALGVKVQVAGRLGGAEIARTQWYREGQVPLQRLRADIDYALAEAHTTYGVLGVKVWISRGDVKPQSRGHMDDLEDLTDASA